MERVGQAQQGWRLCILNSMKKHNFLNDLFVSRNINQYTMLHQPHTCTVRDMLPLTHAQVIPITAIFECKGHDIILYTYV